MRGGANGARIRLAPQKDWEGNEPASGQGSGVLEPIAAQSGASSGRCHRAGRAMWAWKRRSRQAGSDVSVPFSPGRGDATDEMTDAESFEPLEPLADGFRNWMKELFGQRRKR
jgi:catalase-peroxidase